MATSVPDRQVRLVRLHAREGTLFYLRVVWKKDVAWLEYVYGYEKEHG